MSGLAGEGPLIAVVDYGMGNRRSVEKALEHVGARAVISSDPEILRQANGLVVPGVGAFPRAMERLRTLGLDELLRERVAARCARAGHLPRHADRVRLLHRARRRGRPRDRPRAGPARSSRASSSCRTSAGPRSRSPAATRGSPWISPPRCAFYHVHSFAPVPESAGDILATAEYGAPFVSAVERGSFYGVQFHPEKSSAAGLRLLANFVGHLRVGASAPVRR